MADYQITEEELNREGKTWERILSSIDPLLQELAQQHGLQLTKGRWDVPDRELRWQNQTKALHVRVRSEGASYIIGIEGAIWADAVKGRRRQRQWFTETLGTSKPFQEAGERLVGQVKPLLKEAFGVVSEWTIKSLGDKVKVYEWTVEESGGR